MIRFTVDEAPYGKERARTGQGRVYTPAKTRTYERRVKAACQDVMRRRGHSMLEGAVEITIVARMVPPKSASKKKRAEMLAGVIRPTRKPDASNHLKAIEDALNGVAYKDDAQIVTVVVRKVYAEAAGSDVVIQEASSERDHDQARESERQRPEHLDGARGSAAEAGTAFAIDLQDPRPYWAQLGDQEDG